MTLNLPEILNIPPKLVPIITEFNDYKHFLLDGGRGSGKSQSIARFLLYLASTKKVRILCLREVQNSIQESVHQLLSDLIRKYGLDFEVQKTTIIHRTTGSTFGFKGCKDTTADTIKSTEGVDIVWCEEAQSLSQSSLDVLIPTPRKPKVKFFYSMNRFVRADPVYETIAHRKDCLSIHIDYFENPYCPQTLIEEANICKSEDIAKYNHVWLGQPMATTTDYLFNFDKLSKLPTNEIIGDVYRVQRAIGIDFAGDGGDLCVAQVLERVSGTQWRVIDTIRWSDPDTDASVGKSISIYSKYLPDIFVVDASGLGYPMYVSISKVIKGVIGFKGGETDKKSQNSANNRAEGYLILNEYVNQGYLICHEKATIKQMETIRKTHRASGDILMQSKKDMKAKGIKSPDDVDALSMAVWGIKYYLGKQTSAEIDGGYSFSNSMQTQVISKRLGR